jgi:hypothetical protein
MERYRQCHGLPREHALITTPLHTQHIATMKTALKFLFALAGMFITSSLMAAAVASVSDLDFHTVRNVLFVLGFFPAVPAGSLAVMSSASIAAFVQEFGAYYQPRGQNAERLRQLLMQDDGPFSSQFTLVPLEGDTLEYALMEHDRVLQPFKPVWSPTGQLSGVPRKITLRRVKVNVEEIPDYLVNMWLGFLTSEGGRDPNINRATWPFVRWYVERYLLPQAKEDQYYEAYYGVWANPGSNNTPGAHGTSLDGIAVQLNRDVDNGSITPISTGAFDADPELFVDQIEDFCEQFDNRYRGMNLVVNMHDVFAQRFKDGMLEKYNIQYAQVGDNSLMQLRKRSNISIRGHFNWLQGPGGTPSEKLFCTPAMNAVKGVRVGNKEDSVLRLEQIDYTLKMFNDWHIFYGYYDPRIVYTNDSELSYGI